MLISDFVTLVPECSPRPATRVHEGGGANYKELKEYLLFLAVRGPNRADVTQATRRTQRIQTLDFEKRCRQCQVLKSQRTGLLLDNGEKATKFYI